MTVNNVNFMIGCTDNTTPDCYVRHILAVSTATREEVGSSQPDVVTFLVNMLKYGLGQKMNSGATIHTFVNQTDALPQATPSTDTTDTVKGILVPSDITGFSTKIFKTDSPTTISNGFEQSLTTRFDANDIYALYDTDNIDPATYTNNFDIIGTQEHACLIFSFRYSSFITDDTTDPVTSSNAPQKYLSIVWDTTGDTMDTRYDGVLRYNKILNQNWEYELSISGSEVNFNAVTMDSSDDVYVAGYATGDIDGDDPNTHSGGRDSALIKLSNAATATSVWMQQYGDSNNDEIFDIDIDSDDNVYALGYETEASGYPEEGIALKIYDSLGILKVTGNISPDDYINERGFGVKVTGNPSSNKEVYITGSSNNAAVLVKCTYDNNNTITEDWRTIIPTNSSSNTVNKAIGVFLHSTHVYTVGENYDTTSSSTKVFLSKNNISNGTQVTFVYLNEDETNVKGVDFDATNELFYTVGSSGVDAYISCYNLSGVRQWTETLSSSGQDYATSVQVKDDNVLVSGYTTNDTVSEANKWFVAKYSHHGYQSYRKDLESVNDTMVEGMKISGDTIILSGSEIIPNGSEIVGGTTQGYVVKLTEAFPA